MKRILSALAATALAISASAQSEIRVEVKNAVYESEQFRVAFVVEGEHQADRFEWECPSDFSLVFGPQQGRSSAISIVNGRQSKSVSTTYTYVLMPKRPGTFTLPPASAVVQKRTIVSKPVSVEVVPDGSSSGGQQQTASRPSRQEGELFLTLETDKTSVVVGESLRANLYLYQRANVAGLEGAQFPSFDGFWSNEVETPSNVQFVQKRVGDEIFNVALIRGFELIAQQVGDIEIEPAELVCLINVRTQSNPIDDIFSSFFQSGYQTVSRRLRSKPVTIRVSPLPQPSPATFCGGVGKFRISASVTKDSLKAHEAASLVVKVSGTGNLALLEAPKISFPPDFEVYDVKISEQNGSRVFEYPFIPRSHGDFFLGPFEMSYYDLQTRRYATASSPAIPLGVKRSTEVVGGVTSSQSFVGVAARDVRNLGSDIRFITTQMPALKRSGDFFVWSGLFWTLAAALAGLSVALFFLVREMRRRKGDVVATRGSAATRNARKRLARASGYLAQKMYVSYYEELHRALLGFASDKLAIDVADLSKDNISARMLERGAAQQDVERFVDLLDGCEFARYAQSDSSDAARERYDAAVGVVSSLDQSLRKARSARGGAALAALALLAAGGLGLHAAEPDAETLWTKGVESYMAADWASAADAWEQISALGYESPELSCNIGSAHFKAGDPAGAVLWFRRALKLDPSMDNAAYNLDFVRTLCQDRIEAVPEFFLKTWARSVRDSMGSDSWAVLALVLLAMALCSILLFALSRRSSARKAGFFGAIVLLLCFALSLCAASSSRSDYFDDSGAVVVAPVSAVRSSPGLDAGTNLFVLHEGTCVRILDSVGSWYCIELADGRQGWLESQNLTII